MQHLAHPISVALISLLESADLLKRFPTYITILFSLQVLLTYCQASAKHLKVQRSVPKEQGCRGTDRGFSFLTTQTDLLKRQQLPLHLVSATNLSNSL